MDMVDTGFTPMELAARKMVNRTARLERFVALLQRGPSAAVDTCIVEELRLIDRARAEFDVAMRGERREAEPLGPVLVGPGQPWWRRWWPRPSARP